MDLGIHIGTRGCLTSHLPIQVGGESPPVRTARQGPDGRPLFSGSSSDMLGDAGALEMVGARHVILDLQRPTIEEMLEVLQRFGEQVVRKA